MSLLVQLSGSRSIKRGCHGRTVTL